MKSRKTAIAARVAATLLLCGVATTVMGASSALAEGGSGGIGITVSVTAPPGASTAPVGSTQLGSGGSGAAGSGSGFGSGSGSAVNGSGSTVVTPTSPNAPNAAADEFDLGGILFLSGVSSDYGWSINPLAGDTSEHFTVHNVSQETIDLTANFSIVGPFGNEIARVDAVPITALKPDESRVIEAKLSGVGQWAFITAHATLVPPASVAGTPLTPVTRDGFLFVLPWFIVVLLILGVGAYSVVRLVRGAELTALGVPAGAGVSAGASAGAGEPGALAGGAA
ncbi:hypothetical protein [Subtercola endophyticus]|uniref:hypothetical protein n=1 Tax=Subtercola endophyticus TaxID=2895559 RepID=UPI001E578B70|nr:hypothetical protein [Subtercola endophyticus]UFS59218.1 hypothetical protein LQ955_19950 [Subtercola endophyticus]